MQKLDKAPTIQHAILCAVVALLFYSGAVLDQKIIGIAGFEFPAAAWYFILIYTLTDATTEVYGPRKSWGNLIAGYVVCCLFILVTLITIKLPYATTQDQGVAKTAYAHIEYAMNECFGWGYFVFFIGMWINVKLLGNWKLKYRGRHYFLRSYIASSLSEGFVVIFANILIWSGRLPWKTILYMIVTTYVMKLLLTFFWAFIGVGIKNILYTLEGDKNIYTFNKSFYQKIKNINQ
jgi:uncharacterized integral membrane protein (TIGR00697 family)